MNAADGREARVETVADVMTAAVVVVDRDESLTSVAQYMRDRDLGDVIVMDGPEMYGIVTDRDLVVRGMASGFAAELTAGDVASTDIWPVAPSATILEAARTMADHTVRRLPVIEGSLPIGVVSLGDLATASGEDSVLSRISAAPANS